MNFIINKLIIEKCFVCGKSLTSKPKSVFSKIGTIPQGLDRASEVKASIYKCKACSSFSCRQFQNQKDYSESLCYEASKKTLENSNSFYPYSSDLLPNKIKKFIKQKTFVDFGCGAGFFTKQLKNYVNKVIGVDLDPSGIKTLRKNNIEAYEGDIKILKELEFNSLSVVGVLEHFENPLGFLSEINELLPKENSVVLIYYPNTSSLSGFLSQFSSHNWDMFLEPGHFSFPSKKYLVEFMAKNNFKCKKYWTTSNISRGKNPFSSKRNVIDEKFIRNFLERYSFIKSIYIALYKIIDVFKLGDIKCFAFFR
tara:strand:- start:337 stop:1266 length:930 start_codon:yes stop_codon:yes gene_type:complete